MKSEEFFCKVEIATLLVDVHLNQHKIDIERAQESKRRPRLEVWNIQETEMKF